MTVASAIAGGPLAPAHTASERHDRDRDADSKFVTSPWEFNVESGMGFGELKVDPATGRAFRKSLRLSGAWGGITQPSD
eukprot:448880-Rhodomonas_salina.1